MERLRGLTREFGMVSSYVSASMMPIISIVRVPVLVGVLLVLRLSELLRRGHMSCLKVRHD
jgi:6,7-dimethyl-8-ribityllumazine synthase